MQGEVAPISPMEVGCESFRGGARILEGGGIRSHICILDSCRCIQLLNVAASGGGGGKKGRALRILVSESRKTADVRHRDSSRWGVWGEGGRKICLWSPRLEI